MLELYQHQEKAIKALFDYFETKEGNPLVVAPVGSGKSLLIAEFIKRATQQYPQTNFIVVTHVTELLTQNADHLRIQWPEANYSFYAAKLGKKSFDGQTIFASINSIYKKAYKIPKQIDIIGIDEAHLISPNAQTMYQAFLRDMKIINPNIKFIGFTGTNFRATEGKLTEGAGRIFTDIAYQIPMLYLIEKGFLCPLVTPSVKNKMSTVGVSTRNGDYTEAQLQAAVDKDFITSACVDEIILHGEMRRKWLIFTAGIEHCAHVCAEICARGISCAQVTSETSTAERNRIVKEYKTGELRCLVNVGCFTTGFNNPAIDLMAFMRPTRSPVLYVQMGGRGMRIAEGKSDCCLLDFGGVISELGPIDLIDAHKAAGTNEGGEAPVKVCPTCNAICLAAASICLDCGYEFPDSQIPLDKTATTAKVMSNQIEPEWHKVISIRYQVHEKEGKIPSMCVVYNTFDGPFREWICFQHTGFAREKAVRWHKAHSEGEAPSNISDALLVNYRAATGILTRQAGKYFEIIGYDYDETGVNEDIIPY